MCKNTFLFSKSDVIFLASGCQISKLKAFLRSFYFYNRLLMQLESRLLARFKIWRTIVQKIISPFEKLKAFLRSFCFYNHLLMKSKHRQLAHFGTWRRIA